jgi:prepilin-type N-terminal cleavage/methylation domain-containing protein
VSAARSRSLAVRLRNLAARLRSDQRGITLVELLVAMALTAIVATLVVSIVATATRTLGSQALATTNSETAAVAMRELTRVIRSGAPIRLTGSTATTPVVSAAGATSLTVTSYVDSVVDSSVPVRVLFTVTDGTLTEQRFTVTPVGDAFTIATTGGAARTLASGLTTTATAPLFTFYDAAGVIIPIPSGGTLPETDLPRIAAVRITLGVQRDDSLRATSVTIDNTVSLPNLGISRVRAGG